MYQNRSKFAGLSALLLTAGLLFAQFETAEVLGTVRDASGGAVPEGRGDADQSGHQHPDADRHRR